MWWWVFGMERKLFLYDSDYIFSPWVLTFKFLSQPSPSNTNTCELVKISFWLTRIRRGFLSFAMFFPTWGHTPLSVQLTGAWGEQISRMEEYKFHPPRGKLKTENKRIFYASIPCNAQEKRKRDGGIKENGPPTGSYWSTIITPAGWLRLEKILHSNFYHLLYRRVKNSML